MTCSTNVDGANAGQSVRVAAANQYHEIGVAASLAIGGSAGVAVPVGVRVATVTTNAYIGSGATVNARQDITITANTIDKIVSVGVGVGGGTVGVAGTVTVTVLDIHTYACTGTPIGTDGYECSGRRQPPRRWQHPRVRQ